MSAEEIGRGTSTAVNTLHWLIVHVFDSNEKGISGLEEEPLT
jgi:hypothetical protein